LQWFGLFTLDLGHTLPQRAVEQFNDAALYADVTANNLTGVYINR
jgi:hypothetical protein